MNNADRQKLIEAFGRYPAERFAVVDGAHFDDIATELSSIKLSGEPLFLKDMGDGAELSGPWLVELVDGEAVNRVLTLVGELPAVVFWSWPEDGPDGQKALYKHLRRLNMVEIPVDDYNPDFPDWDRVVLRHADPNVMANTLSVLEEDQFAKVLGSAAALIMYAPDFGGLQEAPRLEHEVEIPKGLLRFEIEQIEMMEDRDAHVSRKNVMAYLRDSADEETADMSDKELYGKVKEAQLAGDELGIETEEAHGLYAFMAITTEGKSLNEPIIQTAFKKSKTSPDRTMKSIFDAMITAAEQDR